MHFLDVSDIHARAARARARGRWARIGLLIAACVLSAACGGLVGVLAARADMPHLITLGMVVLMAGIAYVALSSSGEPFNY
jgi:ribose/xylose/arabinose/galactoside ABC-type transport system permease subunit